MLTHFLRLGIRHLSVQKTYSIINILGLSLGLTSSFVVLIYVSYQTSFDRYNEHLDNIYLVTSEMPGVGWVEPSTPFPLAAAMKNEIPEVKEIARREYCPTTVRYKERVFSDVVCDFADPDIFRVLTLPLVQGDLDAVRGQRDFLVVSESMARKCFGDANAIGETITVTCYGESYPLVVSAVMKDIPRTSTLRADAIGPLYIAEGRESTIWKQPLVKMRDSWGFHSTLTYALLSGSANPEDVSRKMLALSDRHQDTLRGGGTVFHLFPLKDVYFHSSTMVNNPFYQGNISDIYVYASAAVLLLFIGCINYLLLNLGRASLRTREVGIRKVFGARRRDLFWQMVTEAMIVAIIALPLAIGLVELSLQHLSSLLGTRIAATYFHNWESIGGFFAIALFVAVVAGSYVSIFLSRLNPIDTLKNKLPVGSSKVVLRRVLMATQMVIFIALTFLSITIYKQLRFARNGDMGFESSDVMFLYPEAEEFDKSFESFKNELKRMPDVVSVSGGLFLPGSPSSMSSKFPRKGDPSQLVTVQGLSVDVDFVETMGMKIIAGKSFSEISSGNLRHACIINETAAKELGFGNPIGDELGGDRIIGVVRDFHMHSFREKIPPLKIDESTEYLQEVAIRVRPANTSASIKSVLDISRRFNNGRPMEWATFDERVDYLYVQDRKFAEVVGYATGVAILVGCLGIFGMSIFVCQQRVKEIGIRKVLGASVKDVFAMVTREFLALVIVSAVIAYPFAQYAANLWLEGFAYHTRTNVWDILLGVLIDIVVVLLTISVQAVRAAMANPVRSLRYE